MDLSRTELLTILNNMPMSLHTASEPRLISEYNEVKNKLVAEHERLRNEWLQFIMPKSLRKDKTNA